MGGEEAVKWYGGRHHSRITSCASQATLGSIIAPAHPSLLVQPAWHAHLGGEGCDGGVHAVLYIQQLGGDARVQQAVEQRHIQAQPVGRQETRR